MIRRALVVAAIVAVSAPAFADDATPTPTPSATPASSAPQLPKGIQNSQYGQAISDIIQGALKRRRDIVHNGAHGTVTYFKRFELQVQTDPAPFTPSTYRQIHLHQGTVINPRGTTLQQGMIVDVSGHEQPDGSLNADLITVVK